MKKLLMDIIQNKKGIELTLNFLVMMILGIAMLSGAMYMSTKLFSKAKASQASVDQSMQEEIKRLITDTDSLVVIYPARKTINRKESAAFGVGIQNVKDTPSVSDKFEIDVDFSKAYDKDNNDLGNINQDDWLKLGKTTQNIKKNEMYSFPVLITVPKGTTGGIYIFDVKVCEESCSGLTDSELYDQTVHKLYVKVE